MTLGPSDIVRSAFFLLTCVQIIKGPEFVEFLSLFNDFWKYLGGHLAPSSPCSILMETPIPSKLMVKMI